MKLLLRKMVKRIRDAVFRGVVRDIEATQVDADVLYWLSLYPAWEYQC